MKRDMDLVRDLLLKIEAEAQLDRSNVVSYGSDDFDRPLEEVNYHLVLMMDADLIEIEGRMLNGDVLLRGLTWQGHEYLETIRDPEIWKKTKEGARKVGSMSLDVLRDIAKGLVKKKIKELSDVDIDI